jgi:hypothetical protein
MVESPESPAVAWEEVTDFGGSGENDRHYTLDELDGSLAFGPSLLQPNGSVYRFGAVPPKNSLLRFTSYQHGGGVDGNVPVAAISVLKSSIPYIARVNNRERGIECRASCWRNRNPPVCGSSLTGVIEDPIPIGTFKSELPGEAS